MSSHSASSCRRLFRPFTDERFARGSRQQWETQPLQLVEMRQQRIVLFEVLAEAEAGIEHDARALHAALEGHLHAVGQIMLHQRDDVRFDAAACATAPGVPRVCIITTPHCSSAQVAAICGSHCKRADVVDDLRARADGCARDLRFVRVDGDQGVGTGTQDRLRSPAACGANSSSSADHGACVAGRFVASHARSRPRRFAADVEDVGALVQQLQAHARRRRPGSRKLPPS